MTGNYPDILRLAAPARHLYRRLLCLLLLFVAPQIRAQEPLPAGELQTPVITLQNEFMQVQILPELGGKIISLTDRAGREYLSRSSKPYQPRTPDMEFGDSEFDGIDELFPTLGACTLEHAGQGIPLPGHGLLFRRSWQTSPVVVSATGKVVRMWVDCAPYPARFTRLLRLEEEVLSLEYEVENLSEHPLPYVYVLHPLLAGREGDRLTLEAGESPQAIISWSPKSFLGKRGEAVSWQDLLAGPLEGGAYRPGSGIYYKYFLHGMKQGVAHWGQPEKGAVTLEWPVDVLPYLAVWCSQSGVGELEHLAPEPTNTRYESLADALKHGEARHILPGKPERWTIRLRLTSPRE